MPGGERREERIPHRLEDRVVRELERGGEGQVGRVEERLRLRVLAPLCMRQAGRDEHVQRGGHVFVDVDGEVERMADPTLVCVRGQKGGGTQNLVSITATAGQACARLRLGGRVMSARRTRRTHLGAEEQCELRGVHRHPPRHAEWSRLRGDYRCDG